MNKVIEKLDDAIEVAAISEKYKIGYAKLKGNCLVVIGLEKDKQNEQGDILIFNSEHKSFKMCLNIVNNILNIYESGNTMNLILPGKIDDPVLRLTAIVVEHINKYLN